MRSNNTWRKSTYSGGENNACVELACTLTAVRDSKNPGPVLRVNNVITLVQDIKHGRFDL